MVSNPVMYESRYTLFDRFKNQFKKNLIVCEVAYGTRAFEITEKKNPNHIQLRTKDELWHKENALNVAVQHLSRLDPEWKYVCFIDADVEFTYERFEEKIVHALQHYKVIQPWSHAVDLGPDDEPIKISKSFLRNWTYGEYETEPKNGYYYYQSKGFHGHPGYALAMTRDAFDSLGGLIDTAILGSGDHHMIAALCGMVENTFPSEVHYNYKKLLKDWQSRAVEYIDFNLGYVAGGLKHYFHGAKRNRKYRERWSIVIENDFDPLVDIKRDAQGLYSLDGTAKLRNDIRAYFRSRAEDSKEL